MIETALRRVIRRVRPRSEGLAAGGRVQLGWLIRMGAIPLLRGSTVWFRMRFRADVLPLFVGRGVKILYIAQLWPGPSVFIGDGTRINAFTKSGIRLGAGVTIRENGWIQGSSSPSNPGEELVIGANTYIGPSVILGVGGPIRIGANCQFGAGVVMISENHADEAGVLSAPPPVTRKGITIGDDTWLGHRVVVLDGVTLGARCVVGAGSVVTKSFGDGVRLAGVPARVIA